MRTRGAISVFLYIVLAAGSLVMVFPFVWTVLSAFKQPQEIIAYPIVWISSQPTLQGFERVFTQIRFGRFFANSLFIAAVTTAAGVYTSALCGYVFGKYQFRGRDVLFIAVLATMMIPWPVTLVPSFLMTVWLKLVNTRWALIIPALYSSFGIFLMRQYMHTVPDELLDAARIDGASEVHIFHQIAIPLCMPALAALGIFLFLSNWDNFLWPLIVLSKEDLYTLPLGLKMLTAQSYYQGQYQDYSALLAGTAIAEIPMILAFLVLQRRIVEGITLTGMKM
jgi:multiple sugar transport system permease protein